MADIKQAVIFSEAQQAAIQAYIEQTFVHEETFQEQARNSTAEAGLPQIDIRPVEGQFLWWLGTLIKATRILEVGTLAGYSAMWLARALPLKGELISLEADPRHAQVAQHNIEAAGMGHLIKIIVGDAHETIRQLEGPFDMVFIDAEKEGYADYLEAALGLLRPGGVIAAHNALMHGDIVAEETSERIEQMRAFNQQIASDPRLLSILYPAGDGFVIGIYMP